MATAVPKLRTTAKGRENLGRYCHERIIDLEAIWSEDFEDQAVWWDWYETVPFQQIKSWPWPNASNVVLPVIRTHADTIAANIYSLIFSYGNVWSGKTQNHKLARTTSELMKFLNHVEGIEFDLETPVWDWLNEITVIGRGTLWSGWNPRRRYVLVPGSGQAKWVQLNRGPVVWHVPAYQLLHPVGESPRDTSFLARQTFMPWDSLVRAAQGEGWDLAALDECKNSGGLEGSVGGRVYMQGLRAQSISQPATQSRFAAHDIRDVWMDVPLGREFELSWKSGAQSASDRWVKVRVTYHAKAKRVLRVEADPYGLGRNPAYTVYYRKRAGHPNGVGCAKILEQLQRSESTMFNQAIDAVTLANSISYKTNSAKLKDHVFSPSTLVHVPDGEYLEPIQPNKSVLPDISMMRTAQTYGERAVGVSDPLLGRESRSGGHPSPATNFIGMQEAGRMLQSPTVKRVRRNLGDLGLDLLTMYQLFDTDVDQRAVRYLGERDAAEVQEFFFPRDDTLVGNLVLDIFAVNEVDSPQAKQQRAVVVSQMTNNIASTVIPMLQGMFQPNVPAPVREALAQFVSANLHSFRNFLEASEIDNIEDYAIEMERISNGSTAQLESFQQSLLRAIGAEPGGVPQAVPGQPGMEAAQPVAGPGAAAPRTAFDFAA